MNQFENYSFYDLMAIDVNDLTPDELSDYHDEVIIRQEQLEWWSQQNIANAIDELNAELEC